MENKSLKAKLATYLQRMDAVLVDAAEPFVLTSGESSPVYADCRRVIADPEVRRAVVGAFAEIAERYRPEIIAGGETAGIPLAALLAEKMSLPMVYIRKKRKDFGKKTLIEGGISLRGRRLLLVEDLSTDGGSKSHFINAINADGGSVAAVLVIFSYGLEKELGAPLEPLLTWDDFLPMAEKSGYLSAAQATTVRDYLSSRKSAD